MKTLLSDAIVGLLCTESFYAELIMRMSVNTLTDAFSARKWFGVRKNRKIKPRTGAIKAVTLKLPPAPRRSTFVAGVSVKSGGIELAINPKRWRKMPITEQIAVLKHECLHILHLHIPRSIEYRNMGVRHQAMNICMDAAINEFIDGLSPNCIFVPKLELMLRQHIPDLPPLERKATWEYYLSQCTKLPPSAFEDSSGGSGDSSGDSGGASGAGEQVDDHSGWTEGDQSEEAAKAVCKQVANDAAASARARGAGTLSAELESQLQTMNHVPHDWRGVLRKFVARTSEVIIETSRKTRNRRYGIIFPGEKKESRLHLALIMDTSGSVSDEALAQFGAEIDRISDSAKVTVIEADSEVKRVYEYVRGRPFSVSGRGGTAYQPALDKASELEVDGAIYFGDMDSSDVPKKPKYPVLWAIVGKANPPVSWGGKTKIEVRNK